MVSVPFVVSYFSYKYQLHKIRKEVKHEIMNETPRDELVSFTFNINTSHFQELEWEHSREFKYRDEMYDVIEADTMKNMVHYLCFPDKEETLLRTNYKKLLEERYANNKPLQNQKARLNNYLLSIFL